MIPFGNLQAQYQSMKKDIDSNVSRVLDSGRYLLGKECEEFEREFAKYNGSKYAIGVSSGTSALMIALRSIGLRRGDEVIVPSLTAIPNAVAVREAGGVPVFCDVDPLTLTMSPQSLKNKITSRTRAVIPVHLYGHPASLDSIREITRRYGLVLIEDCAQAHGAEYKKRKVGTFGELGCFSFYPSKNLGCFGDGGMIVTDDETLRDRAVLLRNYGAMNRYLVKVSGWNARLSELQAAILRAKLPYLDSWNDKRRSLAKGYNKILTNKVFVPIERDVVKSVYHLYVIRTKNRNGLKSFLSSHDIQSEVHYPIPLHRQPSFFSRVNLPVTEQACKDILSLPMYPELSEKDVQNIALLVESFCKDSKE